MSLARFIESLDEEVGRFLNGKMTDNKGLLAAVFSLNNEIGRQLRPTGDPALKHLQLLVNEVTKAAKVGDRRWLAEAMERVRREALELV